VGIWEYDFIANSMIWSEQTRKLLGVEPVEPASFDLVLSRPHEEDRPRIEKHIAYYLNPDSDHRHNIEFRIRTKEEGCVDTNCRRAGPSVRYSCAILRPKRMPRKGDRDVVNRCHHQQDARRNLHELK
jgi:PAS fold